VSHRRGTWYSSTKVAPQLAQNFALLRAEHRIFLQNLDGITNPPHFCSSPLDFVQQIYIKAFGDSKIYMPKSLEHADSG
jgi:hypothetical protein